MTLPIDLLILDSLINNFDINIPSFLTPLQFFHHHENEIAQSRCANENEVFANYWVHNGFITMSNEKMAKSQGNILKISDLKKSINGQVLRLALISTHYKQALDWNDRLINECQNTINKWYESYVEIEKPILIKFL